MTETLLDVVSFSSRRIAARRALESECELPLFSDPLAAKLAGTALRDARKSSMRNGKPDTRVSRIAVRTKWFDEEVENALRGERGTVEVDIKVVEGEVGEVVPAPSSSTPLASPASSVRVSVRPRSLPRPWPSQVVCLGCGMDTRPWRLDFPTSSESSSEKASPSSKEKKHSTRWFDVDTRCVLRAKARELEEAGADIPEGAFDLALEEEEIEERRSRAKERKRSRVRFPLRTLSYVAVPCDVSEPGALSAALAKAGHDPTKPTIFVAEGLLMYLGEEGVSTCLSAAAELCPPTPPAAPSKSSPGSPSVSSSTFIAVTISRAALKSAQDRSRRRREARGLFGDDVAAEAAGGDLLSAWNFGCDACELPALCGQNGWSPRLDAVASRSDMARRYGPLVGSRGFEYEVSDPTVSEERGSLFFVARK